MATSATTDLRFRLLGPLEVLKAAVSRFTSAASGSAGCWPCSCCTRTSSSPLNGSSRSCSARRHPTRPCAPCGSLSPGCGGLLDDETLVTRPGGYVVYADPSQLDVAEFEALVMEGRSALDEGDPDLRCCSVPLGARLLPRSAARRPCAARLRAAGDPTPRRAALVGAHGPHRRGPRTRPRRRARPGARGARRRQTRSRSGYAVS